MRAGGGAQGLHAIRIDYDQDDDYDQDFVGFDEVRDKGSTGSGVSPATTPPRTTDFVRLAPDCRRVSGMQRAFIDSTDYQSLVASR